MSRLIEPLQMEEVMADFVDLELLVSTDVLKLDSLHYGYWNGEEKLSLENLRRAQVRYTETLISLIPNQVRTILDVGCGIGDVASALAEKGYIVTAISPDQNHKKSFDNLTNRNTYFHSAKFEELDLDQEFDLILMTESQNYFDVDVGFRQCRRFLKRGGYLLVSGIFRRGNTEVFEETRNVEKEYIQKAKNYGLSLTRSVDITMNVLPTLELAHKAYQEYFVPSLNILSAYFEESARLRFKLLKLFFSKEVDRLAKLHSYYEERLDPDLFQEYVRYLRLLFYFE